MLHYFMIRESFYVFPPLSEAIEIDPMRLTFAKKTTVVTRVVSEICVYIIIIQEFRAGIFKFEDHNLRVPLKIYYYLAGCCHHTRISGAPVHFLVDAALLYAFKNPDETLLHL